jgi:hypothetical protein
MKFYDLETEFTFGKFEGKTVRQIIDLQLSYLDWCAINLDHFYISETVIEDIKKIKHDFSISEEGQQKLNAKYATWENEQEIDNDYDDRDDYDDQTDWSNYNDDLDMDQQSPEFWNQF